MKDIQDLAETLKRSVETRIQPRHHEMNDFVMTERPGARPALMHELQQEARAAGLWNMGLTNDSPVVDFFTQMRALRIYDGPDEVHVRTISRHEIAHQKNAAPDGLLHLFCTDFSDRLAK